MSGFRGELLLGDDWKGRDFTGKRVAVLAPGHEAARIVPQVVRTALFVKVFQEEATWLLPVRVAAPRALLLRLAKLHLRRGVADPWQRRLLTPDARFGRRTTSRDRGYYAALQRPNVKLIGWPVYAIVRGGVRSAEGIEHQVDCVIVGPSSVFAQAADPSHDHREEATA